MSREDLLNDLEYVKTLAEEGATTPLLGGRFGLMWGVLMTITFFLHWAILIEIIPVHPQNLIFFWMGFMLIGGISSFVLDRMMSRKPGMNSVANRVEGHVWAMFSMMLLTLAIGTLLNILFQGGTSRLFELMVIFAFAGQGMAYGVVAKMSGQKLMQRTSIASLIASIICFSVYGTLTLYLIAAISTVITVIIPSLISMHHEPKNVV